jgi:hypothetical protein
VGNFENQFFAGQVCDGKILYPMEDLRPKSYYRPENQQPIVE